jgi:hypothetical protein
MHTILLQRYPNLIRGRKEKRSQKERTFFIALENILNVFCISPPCPCDFCISRRTSHGNCGIATSQQRHDKTTMSRLGKKLKKNSESNKTYAETEYFSQRHRQWSRYHVLRPRLPRSSDEKWLETLFQPKTLKTFVGKHNQEVIKISF